MPWDSQLYFRKSQKDSSLLSRRFLDCRLKRRDLISHLEANGCELRREGGRHSVSINLASRKVSTVPRHREINDHLARKICRDLEMPDPLI